MDTVRVEWVTRTAEAKKARVDWINAAERVDTLSSLQSSQSAQNLLPQVPPKLPIVVAESRVQMLTISITGGGDGPGKCSEVCVVLRRVGGNRQLQFSSSHRSGRRKH